MNKEEIIEMARQAGFERLGHDDYDYVCYPDDIESFAKMVADKEREACIAHAMTSAEKAIDVAIKLEREACANICEDYGRAEEMQAIGNDYAEAIRARGQE